MRCIKYYTLFCLLPLMISCESIIDIGNDDLGEVMVLNAQMCTSDSVHTVMLAYSKPEGIFPVAEGQVECYINGAIVAKSSTVDEQQEIPSIYGTSIQGYSLLHFAAHFNPGDEVCIKAYSGDISCEANVMVAQAPKLLDVHTIKCETDLDRETGIYKFEISIEDIVNELNFYSLKLLDESYVQVIEADTFSDYHSGDILNAAMHEASVNNTQEPILNAGAGTISSYFDSGDSYFDNSLNLFTDYLFRDKSYTLTLYSTSPYDFNIKPNERCSGEVMKAYNIARVRLLNMSQEEYLYLVGCQFENSIESSTYLTSDYIYPSNVVGGMGFVAISSVTDYDILISTKEYNDNK